MLQPFISTGLGKDSSYLGCRWSTFAILNDPNFNSMHHRLSNEKPSAVFRLRGAYTPAQLQSHSTLSSAAAANDVTAILGIAVEPIQAVEAQISAQTSAASTDNQLVKAGTSTPGLSDPSVLAERIVKHMLTYLSSFGSVSPDTVVPLNIIRKWYDNFLVKVRSGGVGFLENQD